MWVFIFLERFPVSIFISVLPVANKNDVRANVTDAVTTTVKDVFKKGFTIFHFLKKAVVPGQPFIFI